MITITKICDKIKALTIYKWQFQRFGHRSRIDSPLKVDGKKYIKIGNHVLVQYKTWLACLPLTGTENPILIIEDNATIGNFNHIYATQKIVIEANVLTGDKVYITDNLHSYENLEMPVIKQPIKQINEVVIGEGSWLGENVCVIGAKIGKHCVIGANAVVTKDIPDYSVVVGIPATIIKRYNFESQQWEKTDCNGTFIKKVQ